MFAVDRGIEQAEFQCLGVLGLGQVGGPDQDRPTSVAMRMRSRRRAGGDLRVPCGVAGPVGQLDPATLEVQDQRAAVVIGMHPADPATRTRGRFGALGIGGQL